ncbi:MAG TPA: hypothetical protein VM286_00570 [Candidatus Thermoplasmatota archaeon]|nr:hypothetical protein [Candidatus Thermoplasmatota archaeon]
MMARLAGAAACGLALLAGAPWWCLLALPGFLLPGRVAPILGTLVLVVLLPAPVGATPLALLKDAALVGCGLLAAWACFLRQGREVPWVAVPYYAGLAIGLCALWLVLPPRDFWVHSDVAARARILVLMAAALVLGSLGYLPRYRNGVPEVPGARVADSGSGTDGTRADTL